MRNFMSPILSILAEQDPTEYLKSLSSGVSGDTGQPTGGSHLLAFIILIIGVVLILLWWNARQSSPKKAKPVNHSRKLLRQISREMGLAGDEVKQLKVLADIHEQSTGQPLQNPLTLLICPSILTKSLETDDVKIDRAVVARMARRVMAKAKA